LFSQIADTYLKPAREVLKALKRRDYTLLAKLDDVRLPKIEDLILRGDKPVDVIDHGTAFGEAPDSKPEQSPDSAPTPKNASPGKSAKSAPKLKCKLLDIVGPDIRAKMKIPKKAHEALSDAYEALSKAGYIKSGIEFWAS
jgi:hypothetical protein